MAKVQTFEASVKVIWHYNEALAASLRQELASVFDSFNKRQAPLQHARSSSQCSADPCPVEGVHSLSDVQLDDLPVLRSDLCPAALLEPPIQLLGLPAHSLESLLSSSAKRAKVSDTRNSDELSGNLDEVQCVTFVLDDIPVQC